MPRARQSDVPALREIWRECFHDGDDYLDFYFAEGFSAEETLVLKESEEPLAMLRQFGCTLRMGEERFPLRYIYAAATHPKAQGRGLMTRLLEEAFSLCEQDGVDGLILIPQTPELFRFYEKQGYQIFCWRQVDELPLHGDGSGKIRTVSPSTLSQYQRERAEDLARYPGAVEQGAAISQYFFKELEFLGGKLLNFHGESCQGYVVCYMIEETITVKETSLPQNTLAECLGQLWPQAKTIRQTIPAKSGEGTPYGMCRPFSRRLKALLEKPPLIAMGCMLDE